MELVTVNNFEEKVTNSNNPVLLDFFANWCMPCKALEGILKEVENNYADKVTFYKVNVDDEMDLAVRFQVNALPTIILCKAGESVDKLIGLSSTADVESMLSKGLD